MLEQTDTMSPDTMPSPVGDMIAATLSCPQPNTTVCTVTGNVDLTTVPLLANALTEAIHDDRPHLVVDLSAATLLDSAGLQAVVETLDRYQIDGHLAVVVDPYSEAVTAITRPEIIGLEGFLDMHRDLRGALRACAHASVSTPGRHRAKAAD
jgi:anti-anti-sigma factor